MRDRLVEELGSALTEAGLPSLPSRVFAALLLDGDGRMTSADLTYVLGGEAADVSGALTRLSGLQLVRREDRAGDRPGVYVVDDDALPVAMVHGHQPLAPVLRAFGAAIDEQGPRSRAYRRLMLTAEFVKFLDGELDDLAVRWETHRAAFEQGL